MSDDADVALTECRLLVHPPGDGAWNMAVDEHLLGWTSDTGRCCWRFYQWAKPTLSLGYFQQYIDRGTHVASRGCPAVRRASGGGAILHDQELTYSLTVPVSHPLGRRRQWTYEAIHQTLIEVLAEWGVQANIFGTSRPDEQKPSDFLCFNRRSPGDVVVADAKIAGSAQRRVSGAVLQHGSVLLHRSSAAPELPGLSEATGAEIEPAQLMPAWLLRLAAALKFRWLDDRLSGEEEGRIASIVAEKFGHSLWTEKRSR